MEYPGKALKLLRLFFLMTSLSFSPLSARPCLPQRATSLKIQVCKYLSVCRNVLCILYIHLRHNAILWRFHGVKEVICRSKCILVVELFGVILD